MVVIAETTAINSVNSPIKEKIYIENNIGAPKKCIIEVYLLKYYFVKPPHI